MVGILSKVEIGNADLYHGDCLEVMRDLPENSVDSIVTDPPYGLEFMGKDWDKFGGKPVGNSYSGNGGMKRYFKGNKPIYKWDMTTYQEFSFKWATEALRVAKPGTYLLSFGGTRTFHRLACAIEDSGWEIRDTIMWVYGSGFPKSYNIAQSIQKKLTIGKSRRPDRNLGGLSRNRFSGNIEGKLFADTGGQIRLTIPEALQWNGWGTALKPAWEPIIVARKPIEGTVAGNVLKWGTGGMNIDGCRVGTEDKTQRENKGVEWGDRKPEYYINREKEVFGSPLGRFPANLIHDGSEEVMKLFPVSDSTRKNGNPNNPVHRHLPENQLMTWGGIRETNDYRDRGSAARFFYCVKASKSERNAGLEGMEAKEIGHNRFDICAKCGEYILQNPNRPSACKCENPVRKHNTIKGNSHPTVKPLALMCYLCRLVTPPNGVVLDNFMGSGSTGVAALEEGFKFVGIDTEQGYFEIACKRIAEAQRQLRLGNESNHLYGKELICQISV